MTRVQPPPDQHPECTYKTASLWVRDLCGERWPQPDSPTSQAITKCFTRIEAVLSKLRKQHSSLEKEKLISDYLDEEFNLPKLGLSEGKVVVFSPTKKSTRAVQANALKECVYYDTE